MMRPVLTWLTYTGKAAQMALSDPFAISTFISWPTSSQQHTTTDSMWAVAVIRLMSASVAILTLTSQEAGGGAAAGGATASSAEERAQTRRAMTALLSRCITTEKWEKWLADASSAPEWRAATSTTTNGNTRYDQRNASTGADNKQQSSKDVFALVDSVVVLAVAEAGRALADMQATHNAAAALNTPATAPPSLDAVSSSVGPAIAQHQLSDVDDSDSCNDDSCGGAHGKEDESSSTSYSSSLQQHNSNTKSDQTYNGAKSPSLLPCTTGAVQDAPSSGGGGLAAAEKHHEADAEVRRLLAVSAAQDREIANLRKQLSESNAAHQQAMRDQQMRLAAATALISSLESQLAAEKSSAAEISKSCAEQIAAAEEINRAHEEETRQLTATLCMLETRLASTREATSANEALREQLEAVTAERDELLILLAELDEEREVMRDGSAIIAQPNTSTDDDDKA
jgi:hypothetical protein